MSLLRKLLFILPASLLFAVTGWAQTAAFEGTVKGADGKPAPGVQIKIERQDVRGNYNVKTDKKGHYFYGGLPFGRFKISVNVDGAEKDNKMVQSKLGDTTDVSFDFAQAAAVAATDVIAVHGAYARYRRALAACEGAILLVDAAQEEYIQLGVASGRYATPETAVGEALMQWEERQRQRLEILSAIDISRAEFEPIALKADATDVVFMGELRPEKGIDVLIDAIARLNAAGIETVGSTPAQLTAVVKEEMATLGKVIREAGMRVE